MKEPNLYDRFKEWFLEKEHPHSKLNKTVFIHDLLKFIGFILVLLILYNNVEKLNQITLIFIKFGSLILLATLFFVIRKGWHLCKNLKYWFRGFNNGTKLLIGIGIVLLLLFAFFSQDKVIENITSTYDNVKFNSFNPVKFGNFSFSFFNSSKIGSSKIYQPSSTVRLVPSEMDEYGFWKDIYKSCASLEALGESQGISDMKQKSCREICGKRSMDYSSNTCEKDKLVCYCTK